MTNQKPIIGTSCDHEYLKVLKANAEKLHSDIASTRLPISDIGVLHMRHAVVEIGNAISSLEKAYEMYGKKDL